MDVEAVAHAAAEQVAMVRGGGGPSFLEARTYRFRAHSMYDPDLYRAKEEIARWRRREEAKAGRSDVQYIGRKHGNESRVGSADQGNDIG